MTFVRKYTGCNGSIQVAAPSGGAAYNVGGETVHSLLEIPIAQQWKNLGETKQMKLKRKLRHLQV